MKTNQRQFLSRMIGVGAFIAAATLTAHAQFTFPVYEPFNYTEGERLRGASSATTWTLGNSFSATGSPLISSNYAMTYPGLQPDPNPAARGIQGALGVGRTHGALFPNQISNTVPVVYTSFLLNLQTLPSGGRAIYGLNPNGSGTPNSGSGPAIWVDSAAKLYITKSTSTAPTTGGTAALTLSNSYLIVMAYKFSGANNEVDLWVNPTQLGSTYNASIPTPTITTTNGANVTNLQSVNLYAPTGTPVVNANYDEIRIGTNWGQVTPVGPLPGTTYNVTGGGTGCPGTAFPITLSGSDSGVNYLLYTNGAYSGQTLAGTGSGITFAMQTTTAIYSVLGSNTTTAAVGWMNGSPSITVFAGPVITAQPSAQTVATNSTAYFSVTATGVGLNYQWFKGAAALSDGGHLSGSATANLTVSPATVADLGNYFVVISNQCGLTATSSTNALTLQAPGNLTWVGNNPSSNWDISTTANFLKSGSPSVFTPGDNVTFDDTAAEFTVLITSPQTSAGVVSFTAANAVTLGGPGGISGNSSLVMSGGGLVTISNVNTYSGGTTFNSGSQTILRNSLYQGLGTGPLTFNGGLLDLPVSGGSTAGISNAIVVNQDSTLEFEGTGSFAGVIFGALSGTSGKTLTLSHLANTSTDRFRVYNTNFTMNANIDLASGNMLFAPYNSAGTQVYNGIISDSGGLIARNGGGIVIFNGANTFSGGSRLTTGSIGIGNDAGALGTGDITLTLDGTPAVGSTANSTLFASGGNHTLTNTFVYLDTLTAYTLFIGSTNQLTLSADYNLAGADATGGVQRLFNVTNAGAKLVFSGVVNDAGLNCGIAKSGPGGLVLANANTYTGATGVSNGTLYVDGSIGSGAVTVTNATLAGVGVVGGPVAVQSGTIAPGDGGIGSLSAGAVTMDATSTLAVEVNKTAGTHDLLTVPSITYAGTLNASNLSGTITTADTFHVVNATTHTGTFSAIAGSPGSGKAWTFNYATGTLGVAATISTNATNITYSVSVDGNNNQFLTLNWPTDHLGWRIQSQTNATGVGITTNWFTVAGSTNVIGITNIPINRANGSVFYRMIYP